VLLSSQRQMLMTSDRSGNRTTRTEENPESKVGVGEDALKEDTVQKFTNSSAIGKVAEKLASATDDENVSPISMMLFLVQASRIVLGLGQRPVLN
jgi:hypothetical protein